VLDRRPTLFRAAKFLSTIGNPLVTSAFMIGAACFHFLDRARAAEVLAILILCVIAPITWWNGRGVQKGQYSDFDVSRRQDRVTMYPIVVLLPLIGSIVLWVRHQPAALSGGMLSAGLMSLAAFVVNRWIKISLHAAFSFYYAAASAALGWAWVPALTIFAVLVTASRWIVGRHVWRELVLGSILGLAAGFLFLAALGIA